MLREMKGAGHMSVYGEKRSSYRILVGKLEGKKPFRIPWHRRDDSVKSIPRITIGWNGQKQAVGPLMTRWQNFGFHKIRRVP